MDGEARRRVVGLVLVCLALAALLGSGPVFATLHHAVERARPVIAARPLVGGALFVLLSALSAMLAFFSTTVLVPVAIAAWGAPVTALLLWVGWLVGGAVAYTVARTLGRPVVRALFPSAKAARWRDQLSARSRFVPVLLLQLALPSELPGYLCGLARVRAGVYLGALAVAELPFALGTVLLGEGVLARRATVVLAVGVAGAALMLLAWRRLVPPRAPGRRPWRASSRDPHSPPMGTSSESRGELAGVVQRNIRTLLEMRRRIERQQTRQERTAAAITRFTGSMAFVYLHAVIFGGWIVWNLKWVPLPKFDPYPFVMLAMAASVEAIFLSTFVLITQNRMAALSERQSELDLQINLLAEHEVTRLIELTEKIALHVGVEIEGEELAELKQDVAPEQVLDEIDHEHARKPPHH